MSTPEIRAIYDISLLGISHRNRRLFGLSRIVECLLQALLEEPSIELWAFSNLSFDVWVNCRQYVSDQSLESELSFFFQTDGFTFRERIYQLTQYFVARLKTAGISKADFLTSNIVKLLDLGFDALSSQNLTNINLYHSFYHSIPEVIIASRDIKKILTVHDIIPILYPEFFGLRANFTEKEFDPEFNLRKSLNSIGSNTWITCPSYSTKNDLCNYLSCKIDSRKVIVTPWAASNLFYVCRDTSRIDAVKRKYGIPPGSYILSLSTLEPRKNINHVIRCFSHLILQEKITDLVLVLAGALGWKYDSIFQELSHYNLPQSSIILTGYVADADLAPLYSGALAFVYPSLYEGFGLPPLEAMQCGTPVITSNTSSLPEVVGEAGLMVAPHDQTSLCQNLLDIYNNLALRADLSKKSLVQAQQFSWKTCTRQTMEVYHQALAED
jgi:glycosyltransferase involved in cell wall biosynthesis